MARINNRHRNKLQSDSILKQILKELKIMALSLDRLTASVAANSSVDDSVLALVAGMAAQIKDLSANAGDVAATQAALDALSAELDAKAAAIAAAVAANTPAAGPALGTGTGPDSTPSA